MDRSKIEWTDASWNPIRAVNIAQGGIGHFCVHVSEGCRNCYAERQQPRFRNPIRFAAPDITKVDIFLDDKMLTQPLRWQKPRMIFVGSMTDIFGHWVTDDMLDRLFAVMALCPQHTFQVLTKRPERMREYLKPYDSRRADGLGRNVISLGYDGPLECLRWPLPNVWLGVSVEDQMAADQRIPILLDTPAALRFLSCEPLLGPVNVEPGINWVIAGGESGPKARPMHPEWVRALRDQCQAAGVPFFFKQWGEWGYFPAELPTRQGEDYIFGSDGEVFGAGHSSYGGCIDPDWREKGGAWMRRVGKKRAGNTLDGRQHLEWPEARS